MRVEEQLGEGYVRLRVSEAERRQAKHDIRCIEDVVIELLRNSRDAGARRIFVASNREGTKRTLVVLDDGSGIPRDMWERIFDARVTSKLDSVHTDRWGVHGRGMALFSIKQNVSEAQVKDSGPGLGSALHIASDTQALPERADQSTWPAVRGSSGHLTLGKGPHNIVRTCCEFALEEEGCNVYVGSPAEIVATVLRRIPKSDPSLRGDGSRSSVLGRLANASGPRELSKVAQELGLDISERTAQRIMSGEIKPLSNTRQKLSRLAQGAGSSQTANVAVANTPIRLSQADVSELGNAVRKDVDAIAKRYYARSVAQPIVHVRGNSVHITIELSSDDEVN